MIYAAQPTPFQVATSTEHFASSTPTLIFFLIILSSFWISRLHQVLLIPKPVDTETRLFIQRLLPIYLFQDIYVFIGEVEGAPVAQKNDFAFHPVHSDPVIWPQPQSSRPYTGFLVSSLAITLWGPVRGN